MHFEIKAKDMAIRLTDIEIRNKDFLTFITLK